MSNDAEATTASVVFMQTAVGKTIAAVEEIQFKCPAFGFRITFTDGSSVDISGVHDEGIRAEEEANDIDFIV